MTIEPIGVTGVALYISPADLRRRNLDPENLPFRAVLDLAREVFWEAGITIEGTIEVERIPGVNGLLVFARTCPRGEPWYVFDRPGDLLGAARALGDRWSDARLTLWRGAYWLRPEGGDERVRCCLSEFGRRELPPFGGGKEDGEAGGILIPGEVFLPLLRLLLIKGERRLD